MADRAVGCDARPSVARSRWDFRLLMIPAFRPRIELVVSQYRR